MISPDLADRLRRAGVDPSNISDPGAAWQQLHDEIGGRATVIDRYELEAHHRGIAVDEIPPGERNEIARSVLRVQIPGIEMAGQSRRDQVEIVAYDDSWPERFQAWKERLEAVVDLAASIHHVGSTSVPGLAAKPVIDVLVVVPDIDDEDSYLPGIESLGVPLRSREPPHHRYFRPGQGQPRVVQIHVSDAEWAREHLLFRDYLRTHSTKAEAYATLKRDLAATYRSDRLAYTDGKTGFILDTLDLAERWATETEWTP
jgi:GrpB-like predicted nucleotidyltransferase (UPF0157 family)